MASILPFEELNNFTLKLRSMFPDGRLPPREEAKQKEEDIIAVSCATPKGDMVYLAYFRFLGTEKELMGLD